MPHQLAVRSGVIQPKYPAAPRQWVSYMGDQPQPSGALPTPNLNTGIRRDFSRGWGGDRESQFPKLDATARAFTLGAIGKVLSQGLQGGDESGDSADPSPPDLPPAPSPGTVPSKASPVSSSTAVSPFERRKLYGFEKPVGDDDEPAGELPSGTLGLPSGMLGLPSGRQGIPQGAKGELPPVNGARSPLETGPGVLPSTSRSTEDSESMPSASLVPDVVYAGGARPPQGDVSQRAGGPTTSPAFAASALTRQQNAVKSAAPRWIDSGNRGSRVGMSQAARDRIKDDLAKFEGYQ
jgi:hypothetical protein